jgi:hypothetical protein
MAANVHPTSGQLGIAALEPERAAETLDHVEGCVACRVRLARIRRDLDIEPADGDSLRRVLEASSPLPDGLTELIRAERDGDPRPGEVWRVGRDEALLVWTRKVFDDGVADIVPLVLDIELADEESILVGADTTPLATELAAMVPLRTTIDLRSFLNRIGDLDLGTEVDEVMNAVRQGRRPSGFPVGAPIVDDDDQRIEYRQVLRDLLSDLSPDAWAESTPEELAPARQEQRADKPPDGLDHIVEMLVERVAGVKCRVLDETPIEVNWDTTAHAVLKVSCLDTAVFVVTVDSESYGQDEIVAVCEKLIHIENDVEAIAVTVPGSGWRTSLFTSASLRGAIILPSGADVGPVSVSDGLDLLDTLMKHLDGAVRAWDVTEQIVNHGSERDLRQIVVAHAESAVEDVKRQGRLARQPEKKATWQELPAETVGQVAQFVDAVVSRRPMDEALRELGLEDSAL